MHTIQWHTKPNCLVRSASRRWDCWDREADSL